MKEIITALFAQILDHYKDNKMAYAVLAAVLAVVLAVIMFTSCGTTRATITNPQKGSTTTITITTNNPIETNVSPDLDLNYKPSTKKGE